jgi:putative membrane protein
MKPISHRGYLAVLGVLFGMLWLALAIEPRHRDDWALENVLVAVFILAVAASHRRFLLSRISYTLIFLFLCVHAVGAHYTYAEVPYDAWSHALTGRSLNEAMGWQRNHFDRFAHFLYGLLMAYPLREFFLRIADVRGFWGYFLPLEFTIATSALYELLEWGAAGLFGGELGAAYLGTQGDIWDAQRDMALASAGALIAMAITALINAYLQHDFARELQHSLRVKALTPLGEDEIARLRRTKRLLG